MSTNTDVTFSWTLSAVDTEPARPPYPHTRNDCVMCREWDGDVLVLGDQPTKANPNLLLCQRCLGRHLTHHVITQSDQDFAQPITVTVALASGLRT